MDKKKLIKGLGIGAAAAGLGLYAAGEVMWYGVLTKKGSDKMSKIFGDDPVISDVPPAYDICEGADEWFEETYHRDVTVTNSVGDDPRAVIFENEGSHKWAIICHGYTSGPGGMARYAREYYKRGYNLILPYMRGHEKGVRAKNIVTYTMGYLDKLDVVAWINYAVKLDPEAQIVLHGESMGAATVMLVTGEALPDNVVCAIEDCGYTSVWDEFSHQIGEMFHLPVFPFLYVAQFCIKRHVDLDFKKASCVEALKKSKTPMLFVHGEADEFVPHKMVYECYNTFDGEKEIMTIPGADHAYSVNTDPVKYWAGVWAFVDKYVK